VAAVDPYTITATLVTHDTQSIVAIMWTLATVSVLESVKYLLSQNDPHSQYCV
jgi:hypothetical protein